MADFWRKCTLFGAALTRVIVSPLASSLVIVIGLLVGVTTGISWWQALSNIDPCQQESEVAPSLASHELGKLLVYVSGAVTTPGVYQLQLGDRVAAAIQAAGGYHPRADLAYVYQQLNLAENITDGQKIYIPFSGESEQVAKNGFVDAEAEQASVIRDTASETNVGVSINQASLAELDALPGVGEKRAQSIVEQRPFSTLDELVTKKILPAATFAEIKEQLSL